MFRHIWFQPTDFIQSWPVNSVICTFNEYSEEYAVKTTENVCQVEQFNINPEREITLADLKENSGVLLRANCWVCLIKLGTQVAHDVRWVDDLYWFKRQGERSRSLTIVGCAGMLWFCVAFALYRQSFYLPMKIWFCSEKWLKIFIWSWHLLFLLHNRHLCDNNNGYLHLHSL